MDPPSPSKFPMSPGMPIFPVSPERVAGTKPPYGSPGVNSPTLPDLRMSPLRSSHRRNDSDVSVHGLAAMFENLEVKDFKEAQAKYLAAMQKQKTKHASEIKELERKHAIWMSRRELRVEELKDALERAQDNKQDVVSKDMWDSARQDHREAIGKWEKALQLSEEKRKQAEKKAHEFSNENNVMKTKLAQYKKRNMELSKEAMRATSYIPTFQAKIQGLERTARIQESDLKYQTGEADKYKNQVYGLQVELESVEARLGEELQAVKEKLALTEGERDALKTSLQEEEVMRIAAEGQIALPATTIEEQDEFASPVRAARKQRTTERDDEDKENMSPKKPTVELKFLQQELASEKRLRERAQEQIEFMKMECQFECCSCRIADLKGAKFVHDGSYSVEMEHIKSSVPVTPPPSNHEDDPMDGVTIKQEPLEDDRPFTFPPEEQEPEMKPETIEEALEMTGLSQPPASPSPEPNIAFSPTTGTFRAMPSPAKASVSTDAVTPANPPSPEPSCIAERILDPPWTPDIKSTVIRTEPVSPPASRAEVRPELEMEPQPHTKANGIYIHEDVVDDNEEEEEEEEEDEDMDAQAPLHDPSAPATPGVFVRTFTTTTTIPLHFSPLTPATKRPDHPMTPSTIAHAPTDAQTPVLGELSMNNLPFDREAALAAIRQRRGRARSMAAGHGTPMKQMMEGVAERRDISAPVSRVRR